MKKIVTIGGGTGSFVVLSGLKNYPLHLTAVVSVADDGGSTGRLRDEFGFLPIGDMRQCLAALASGNSQDYIQKLLLYRFAKGKGLKGHNLGNLLLTGLTDIYGSEAEAIKVASRIFRLQGKILPVTNQKIKLIAYYEDGKIVAGQHNIDEPKHIGGKRIVNIRVKPSAKVCQETEKAILRADLIVLCPGDLYTSILPNLVVKGVREALQKSRAKIAYVVNLMTRFSQTYNFTTQDYVGEIKKYLAKKIDFVLLNNAKIPAKILKLYQKEKAMPVKDDLLSNKDYQIIRRHLLAPAVFAKNKADVIRRSYLRHDSRKLAKAIISLISG